MFELCFDLCGRRTGPAAVGKMDESFSRLCAVAIAKFVTDDGSRGLAGDAFRRMPIGTRRHTVRAGQRFLQARIKFLWHAEFSGTDRKLFENSFPLFTREKTYPGKIGGVSSFRFGSDFAVAVVFRFDDLAQRRFQI